MFKENYFNIKNKKNIRIIDIQDKYDYNKWHLPNSINIPYDEIDENIGLEKEKTILVYCQSGRRSKATYEKLKTLGYEVYDLGAYEKIELEKE